MSEPKVQKKEESQYLKVKPLCKPDAHLKKSRQRIFNENAVDLIYSFGYQSSHGCNVCFLRRDLVIIVAGNFLNFLNVETLDETFVASNNGNGFTCVTVHPSTFYFAAAEKGPKFCINIFTYPGLKMYKTLREETAIMPTQTMQFHPRGDLLVAVSFDPENVINIWHWAFELLLFTSEHSELPNYSMHFSTVHDDVFITSGKGHVTFWRVSSNRDDNNVISEIFVTQDEEIFTESPKLDVYCTISVSDTFVSGTSEGYLLLWQAGLFSTEVIKITLPEDKPLHDGPIKHIIMYRNFIITLGSGGYMKFWNYDEIVEILEREKIAENTESQENTVAIEIVSIQMNPEREFLVSHTSDFIYGIIKEMEIGSASYLLQDKNGRLFLVVISSDLSDMTVKQVLSGLGCSIVGLVSCPLYPFVAVASSLGCVAVYDYVNKNVFKYDIFPVCITSIIWPSAKLDLFADSFIIGFLDGTIKWIAFSNNSDNFILKFVIKPHISAVQFLKMNDSCTVLISQGLDSKLFFFSVENFALIPLGFYINHHEVINFTWLKYFKSSSTEQYEETLLILCEYSYIIETVIPDAVKFGNISNLRKTYYIKNKKCQVYKINGLRNYHVLGDRIYDSDCEDEPNFNLVEKSVLRTLKYEEKKEKRENRRSKLGLSGSITPPGIRSYLSSETSNHIWLSLGKEDFGYLFEFEFQGIFNNEPIELIPIRALEILTAEIVPVLNMQYSPCGKFIFMGLEDGSLNICFLDEAFRPDTGYDFAKYKLHDPDVSAVEHLSVSSEGSFISTAGCDGNILVFRFNLFNYGETEDFGEKPVLSDVTGLEDIPIEKWSLEDKMQCNMDKKYQEMKEHCIDVLESLKKEYLELKDEANEYLILCKKSLKKLKDVPDELIIKPEKFSYSQITIEMCTKATNKLKKDIDVKYETDIVKSTLLYEKLYNFFKARVDQEKLKVKNDQYNIFLSTFRTCAFSPHILDIHLDTYQSMIKPNEKIFSEERRKSNKVWEERVKLEKELSLAHKAIIDYPSDTPVSELVSRYNKRKEEYIELLKEHIAEYEALEYLVIDDKRFQETVKEIDSSQFKFKETSDVDKFLPEYACTFSEKKAEIAMYYRKIHDFCTSFNSLLYSAIDFQNNINQGTMNTLKENECIKNESLAKLNMHICHKRKSIFEGFKNPIKIDWQKSFDDTMIATKEDSKMEVDWLLEIQTEKLKMQQRMCSCFISLLTAAKPKVSCEKKFYEIRCNLKCIELNIFKTGLMKEKKWLEIVQELHTMLFKENVELSALEENMLVLKNNREAEKNEWMNLYHQFRKAIGLKNKHKGYFKEVFKKKIRPDDEKEPCLSHSSSESSESEQDIDSEDDSHNIHPKDVDQNLLKEVMHFRLKRHEIEKRMKPYKRKLFSLASEKLVLQRRIQRVKDAQNDAWDELNAVVVDRKSAFENIIWPAVLYPENVHKNFFGEHISFEDEKVTLHNEMYKIYETVQKELKPINKLINVTIMKVTEKVVTDELNDLIDIACAFFPLVDSVAEEVDEHFRKLSCPDKTEILKEEFIEEKKPRNIIQEILSAAEYKMKTKSDVEESPKSEFSPLKTEMASEDDVTDETVESETVEADIDKDIPLPEKEAKALDTILGSGKHVLKSWRDVWDNLETIPSKDVNESDIDIYSFVPDSLLTLDRSLFVEEIHSSQVDYYMLPLCLNKASEHEKKMAEHPEMTFNDLAKMLVELDVAEVVEDLVRIVVQEEEMNKRANEFISESFPTYPGGGLVLSKDVLLEMEREDPDSYPYSNFYQEIVDTAEKIEKIDMQELSHIEPHYKETVIKYDVSPVTLDFSLFNINDVLATLKAYHDINLTSFEYENQIGLLEKKLSKVKNKRINVEQGLLAISRERNVEMNAKFSAIVDIHNLQDVIEKPHLRIKKYESEKKIDSLKKKLKNLKDSEVDALKSLDMLGLEDTILCHELLKLRHEFKLLNKKYASKLQNFPVSIGDIFSELLV